MTTFRRLLPWAPIGLAALVLVAHSLQYDFVTDDAYISFVFSRNLAEHGQLTFNLGDPVEGYTNFLWTFVLGLLMLVGISPEWSSRVLGTLCGIASLVVTWRLMRRVIEPSSPFTYLPAFFLACSAGFACWTSGGLETQLFTLLVVAAIDQYVANTPAALKRMGIWLALAAMTRPEGLLIAGLIGLHRLGCNLGGNEATGRRLRPTRDELWALGCFLALWAPWFAWRWWYYGWPFPNTYYVKATGAWSPPALGDKMWGHGGHYLWVWLQQTRLIWALPLALLGLVAARPRTPRFVLATLCTLVAGVYLPYAASVGGDFMGLHRFIMPVFVLAAIAVTLGLERLAGLHPITRRPAVAAGLALVVLAPFAWTQWQLTQASLPRYAADGTLKKTNMPSDEGIDTPAYLMIYTDDRATIGKAMAGCFRPDDFSIVGGAGAQPYYGRMRGIDVFGLVSERIAHEEPRVRDRAGHTKSGNNRLLADYDPTFVFSCYDISQKPPKGRISCAGSWTSRGYEQLTLAVRGLELGYNGEPIRGPVGYYTFMAKQARAFECPGLEPRLVKRAP